MTWLLPAIIASLLWGIGQAFIKKGLNNVTPFVSNTFAVVSILIVEVPFALIGGVNWTFFPAILLYGLIASLPNFVFPYVIRKVNVSLAGTVLATYPIYTVLLSVIFLKESLDFIQILGVMGIILGMFFVAKPEKERFTLATWVVWAVVGSLMIGFGDFMGKVALTKYDLYTFILALTLGNVISLVITRFVDRSEIRVEGTKRELIPSIVGNFMMPLGLLFLYIAFSKGPASLVSPVASTYPAITVVLAFLYLKERISKTGVFGIILVTLGVVAVGF